MCQKQNKKKNYQQFIYNKMKLWNACYVRYRTLIGPQNQDLYYSLTCYVHKNYINISLFMFARFNKLNDK